MEDFKMNNLQIISNELTTTGFEMSPIELYNMLENPTYKTKELLNIPFKILGMHKLPQTIFIDDETGEEIPSTKTIYFIEKDEKIETIASYSNGLYKAFNKVQNALGFGINVKIIQDNFTNAKNEQITYFKVLPISE
jgi:hypothetical protein